VQDVFGDRAINWPLNVKWSQDRKPQLSLEANIMDGLTLASYKGEIHFQDSSMVDGLT